MLTDPVDAELIAAAPSLRVISNYAVGVDNVDLDAATARSIPVGHTPDVLTESTADLALALMLGISRRLVEGEASSEPGEWVTWEPELLLGHDLHGATVGIIGFGRIGQAVARRLRASAARSCSRAERRRRARRAARALRLRDAPLPAHPRDARPDRRGGAAPHEADAHTSSTRRAARSSTRRARAPRSTEGEIAGAALDVTDPEPLPADHPLLEAPNLIVIPHLGSATHATRERMADMAVDNLLAGLAGERMPHCANPRSTRRARVARPRHRLDGGNAIRDAGRMPAEHYSPITLMTSRFGRRRRTRSRRPAARARGRAAAVGHRDDHLVVHEQVLQVGVAVVLAAAVVAVVAGVGQQRARPRWPAPSSSAGRACRATRACPRAGPARRR